MLSATPIVPSPDGSPPAAVVSAGLAALARERTARRAAEALAARLEAENAEIAEQVRRLEHLNDELRKLLFGKKSEKLGADERQLSFDDLGTAVSEAGGAPAADEQDGEAEPCRRQRRSARPGARFPAHIERRVDVIEPDSTLCPCGCGEVDCRAALRAHGASAVTRTGTSARTPARRWRKHAPPSHRDHAANLWLVGAQHRVGQGCRPIPPQRGRSEHAPENS